MNYKSIFISDVHLGTNDCKAELLNNFLKEQQVRNTCTLVGDIIDGWKIQQNRVEVETNVIQML
jgi:UDP-2,3-diacylglucosamine pyrophosphatase LpxH